MDGQAAVCYIYFGPNLLLGLPASMRASMRLRQVSKGNAIQANNIVEIDSDILLIQGSHATQDRGSDIKQNWLYYPGA
jgi:hypothetical protein